MRDADRALLKGAWRRPTSLQETRADRQAIVGRLVEEGFKSAYFEKPDGRLVEIFAPTLSPGEET